MRDDELRLADAADNQLGENAVVPPEFPLCVAPNTNNAWSYRFIVK